MIHTKVFFGLEQHNIFYNGALGDTILCQTDGLLDADYKRKWLYGLDKGSLLLDIHHISTDSKDQQKTESKER